MLRDTEHLLNESPELEARAGADGAPAGRHAGPADRLHDQLLVLVPAADAECHAGGHYGEAALAAYYTLTLLSPFVVGESRDYLNFLRAKYLR